MTGTEEQRRREEQRRCRRRRRRRRRGGSARSGMEFCAVMAMAMVAMLVNVGALAQEDEDSVVLAEIDSLVFHRNSMTASRRGNSVRQLQCLHDLNFIFAAKAAMPKPKPAPTSVVEEAPDLRQGGSRSGSSSSNTNRRLLALEFLDVAQRHERVQGEEQERQRGYYYDDVTADEARGTTEDALAAIAAPHPHRGQQPNLRPGVGVPRDDGDENGNGNDNSGGGEDHHQDGGSGGGEDHHQDGGSGGGDSNNVGCPTDAVFPSAICFNMGLDDSGSPVWRCEADLPDRYRLSEVVVSCEGYSAPGDTNVLQGSCAMLYTLTQTPESTSPVHSTTGSDSPYTTHQGLRYFLGLLVLLLACATCVLLARRGHAPGNQHALELQSLPDYQHLPAGGPDDCDHHEEGAEADADDAECGGRSGGSTVGMPPGWEFFTDRRTGDRFYVDHNNKITTWDDPSQRPRTGSDSQRGPPSGMMGGMGAFFSSSSSSSSDSSGPNSLTSPMVNRAFSTNDIDTPFSQRFPGFAHIGSPYPPASHRHHQHRRQQQQQQQHPQQPYRAATGAAPGASRSTGSGVTGSAAPQGVRTQYRFNSSMRSTSAAPITATAQAVHATPVDAAPVAAVLATASSAASAPSSSLSSSSSSSSAAASAVVATAASTAATSTSSGTQHTTPSQSPMSGRSTAAAAAGPATGPRAAASGSTGTFADAFSRSLLAPRDSGLGAAGPSSSGDSSSASTSTGFWGSARIGQHSHFQQQQQQQQRQEQQRLQRSAPTWPNYRELGTTTTGAGDSGPVAQATTVGERASPGPGSEDSSVLRSLDSAQTGWWGSGAALDAFNAAARSATGAGPSDPEPSTAPPVTAAVSARGRRSVRNNRLVQLQQQRERQQQQQQQHLQRQQQSTQ